MRKGNFLIRIKNGEIISEKGKGEDSPYRFTHCPRGPDHVKTNTDASFLSRFVRACVRARCPTPPKCAFRCVHTHGRIYKSQEGETPDIPRCSAAASSVQLGFSLHKLKRVLARDAERARERETATPPGILLMAEEGVAGCTDLPVKRSREGEENGVSAVTMEVDAADPDNNAHCMSSVIPGWFSEISPMWPGRCFFLPPSLLSNPRAPLLCCFRAEESWAASSFFVFFGPLPRLPVWISGRANGVSSRFGFDLVLM